MKIKLLVSLAGAYTAFNSGDVVEWDAEDAARLIAAEYAVEVKDVERAIATPPAERRKKDVASSSDDNGSAD